MSEQPDGVPDIHPSDVCTLVLTLRSDMTVQVMVKGGTGLLAIQAMAQGITAMANNLQAPPKPKIEIAPADLLGKLPNGHN